MSTSVEQSRRSGRTLVRLARHWKGITVAIAGAWLVLTLLSFLVALWAGHEIATHLRAIKQSLEIGSADIDEDLEALDRWVTRYGWAVNHKGNDLLSLLSPIKPVVEVARDLGDASRLGVEAFERGLADLVVTATSGKLLNQDNSVNLEAAGKMADLAARVTDDLQKLLSTVSQIHTDVASSSLLNRWTHLTSDAVRALGIAADGVRLLDKLPEMAGEKGRKDYLIALTTPAELRGLQGLIGNYAHIRLDNGVLSVEEVGSNSELAVPSRLSPDVSPGYAQIFGRQNTEWLNMNMSPFGNDAAAQVLLAWRAMGRDPLDGVIFADTVAVGQIMEGAVSGLTTANGAAITDAAALTEYLTRGVYFDFPSNQEGRKRYQTDLASQLFRRLLSSPIPSQTVFGNVPDLLLDGHIAYLDSESPGFGGALGRTTSSLLDSGIMVAFNNVAGNKADAYLLASSSISKSHELAPGYFETVLEIALSSELPSNAASLPDYLSRRLDALPGDGPASVLTIEVAVGVNVNVTEFKVDDDRFTPAPRALTPEVRLIRHTIVIPAGTKKTVRMRLASDSNAPVLTLPPLLSSWTRS